MKNAYKSLGPYNFDAYEQTYSTKGINKYLVSIAEGTERYEGEWKGNSIHGRGSLLMVNEVDKNFNGQLY